MSADSVNLDLLVDADEYCRSSLDQSKRYVAIQSDQATPCHNPLSDIPTTPMAISTSNATRACPVKRRIAKLLI